MCGKVPSLRDFSLPSALPPLKRGAKLGRPFGADGLIAVALKNRQTGILREARINERKIATKEDGAAIGLDAAGMLAVSTETRIGMRFGCGRHGLQIRQCRATACMTYRQPSFLTPIVYPYFGRWMNGRRPG